MPAYKVASLSIRVDTFYCAHRHTFALAGPVRGKCT